ncbi:MAG TPA: DUF5916 domain-containing protein, partial [Gemmatimonadota bacterium]|nr:DUF5916 domain-containing protein [Gemmatimonadota bacterium]
SRDWSLHGYLAGTLVKGSRQAITNLQENPQHYFQRPDASRLSVDSSATSMTGANWRLQLDRQSAEHWTWGTWIGEITPGFAANDIGFNQESERLDLGGRVDYKDIQPGPVFRSWNVGLFTYHNFRHALLHESLSMDHLTREYKEGTVSLDGDATFRNNWDLHAGVHFDPQSMSDTKTRGGPLMVQPGNVSAYLSVGTDPRNVLSLHPHVQVEHKLLGNGDRFEASARLTIRPTASVEIQVQPSWQAETSASQYVETDEAGGFAPTYGGRYFFGTLHRKQLSMETRLNVAFSPTLSLQLFAQPLLASGHYGAYRQLAAPESFRFLSFAPGTAVDAGGSLRCVGGGLCRSGGTVYLDYDGDGTPDFSFDDQDYNVRSLRGNAVLRWEFRPGSILYFVWQQSRRGDRSFGNFRLGRELDGLVNAPPTNTFIVKASYFLSF